MGDLTNRDRELLDFAGLTWRSTGAREAAIRERFDLSATRYAQRVNALLDEPEALAYAPVTVKRHQRLRARRARERSLPAQQARLAGR